MRTRKLRAALSALGIAIGVAAIVAVLGLSASSQAGLLAEINALGTGALTVDAASLALPATAGTSVAQGSYLNAATAREPVAVLGADADQRLGIDRIWPGERIWVGGMWFYVTGILKPDVLAPEIDSSVLVGYPAAETYLGFDGNPSAIYVKAQTSQVTAVDNLLAAQANPENPEQVDVSQPSAALTAQADAQGAFNGLFLGLGAVALLVGAASPGRSSATLRDRWPSPGRPRVG
jgi:putative ABC transport system permease protein